MNERFTAFTNLLMKLTDFAVDPSDRCSGKDVVELAQ